MAMQTVSQQLCLDQSSGQGDILVPDHHLPYIWESCPGPGVSLCDPSGSVAAWSSDTSRKRCLQLQVGSQALSTSPSSQGLGCLGPGPALTVQLAGLESKSCLRTRCEEPRWELAPLISGTAFKQGFCPLVSA